MPRDAVEAALVRALDDAMAEHRWADVAALSHELRARRRARAAEVD